ncbi:3'-phosphoadenosine 5'-phosphosulfate sulfotransferase [Thelotrema lepadinum]|nr:3'-phosphoadenosine 5'-phosphosulfate sulfotransferase [Thelotrema lepadinum]
MTSNASHETDNSPLRSICREVRRRVDAFLKSDPPTEVLRTTQRQTRESIAVIEEALARYPLHTLSLSYNGGKDCLVLLVLYLSCLATYPSPLPQSLQSIYIVSKDPFAQVDSFVASSSEQYHLDLLRLERESMREAFREYLEDGGAGKEVQAILVGTRRTDPHGGDLGPFSPTDRRWPAFMRVCAVLEWHYREIWAFIRHLEIPYCELYDQGYTSLGGTKDTHPNPALLAEGGNGAGNLAVDGKRYKPAHQLWEDEEERLGRD